MISKKDRKRESGEGLTCAREPELHGTWAAFPEYEAATVRRGRERLRAICPVKSAEPLRIYNPSTEPDLLDEFLNVEDEDGALRFSSKYGDLGYSHLVPFKARVGGEPVAWILGHVQRAQVISAIIREIANSKARGPETLRLGLPRLMRQGGTNLVEDVRTLHQMMRGLDKEKRPRGSRTWWSAYWPSDPVRVACDALSSLLNPWLEGITYKVIGKDSSGIGLRLCFNTLLDIIYWRLAGTLAGLGNPVLCLACRRFFVPRDARQRHCSDHCREAYKYQEKKRRRQEQRAGRLAMKATKARIRRGRT